MSIEFAPGVAQKIRDAIKAWNILPKELPFWVFDELEKLDEDPSLWHPDVDGVFGGAYIHQFAEERPPIVLKASVAFDVERTPEGHVVRILDFASRFIKEE
ncbi:MAG: hypothetical protein HY721_06885 [Planctomycetes bacterium]|nr:hypothetical protein [Planctomycetota bacterium]